MRSLFVLTMITALFAVRAIANDQVVLGEEDIWKLYTQTDAKITNLGDDTAVLGGIIVGTILNDHWGFGVGGYTLLGNVEFSDSDLEEVSGVDFWYAGLNIDYTFKPVKLVHGEASLFAGGGQVRGENKFSGADETVDMTVIEPGISLMVNLAQTIELGAGIGYRFVQGGDEDTVEDSDLSAITGTLYLRFSEF